MSALNVMYRTIVDSTDKRMLYREEGAVPSFTSAYGRILRVNHSQCGENGVLISTFHQEADPNDPGDTLNRLNGHPIYRSDDNGKTWYLQARILDEEHDHQKMIYTQNTVYELPRDIGPFPAGTLLLGGLAVHKVDGGYMRLYVSRDTGRTWKALGTLDSGEYYEMGGVWEPFFVVLDDGTLVCHYCDGRNRSRQSQKLVYRTTKDLMHWSYQFNSVACADPKLRPGMPVVTRLPDGRYFMVYEMVGMEGNPIYCRYSKDGLDWGDPEDWGRRVVSDQGGSLGSSPYCLWVNRGGEKGTLIVCGAFMSKGQATIGTGSDYFVSFDLGETFTQWPHPIPYRGDDFVSHTGYSNSCFFWDEGNILYAINNHGSEDGKKSLMTVAVCDWVEERDE
ncbi:MAG: hypothetical protein E7324_04395 [Clostridiales bacterium]|nr:hypothetical protein [Clostridiales bacterium]